MTGIEDKNELEAALEKEMAKNESEALKVHYERRCKMLSDLAMHWKEQTTILYEKFSNSLAVLKQEQEKYKGDSAEEIKRLKADYEREVAAAEKRFTEVSFLKGGKNRTKLGRIWKDSEKRIGNSRKRM